jgi:hypothetical protein
VLELSALAEQVFALEHTRHAAASSCTQQSRW